MIFFANDFDYTNLNRLEFRELTEFVLRSYFISFTCKLYHICKA